MNLQDLGAIGEVIGGVAVVATLAYLAVQVRQANITTHRNMYAQAARDISDFWLSLAKDHALYASLTTMLRAPETLSEQNLNQGYLVMDSYLSLMESYYLHNKQYGELLSQERWGRMLRRMLRMQGGRGYWTVRSASFHPEFVTYIDGLIENDA